MPANLPQAVGVQILIATVVVVVVVVAGEGLTTVRLQKAVVVVVVAVVEVRKKWSQLISGAVKKKQHLLQSVQMLTEGVLMVLMVLVNLESGRGPPPPCSCQQAARSRLDS
jgi:hypothetical protein